MRVKFKRFFLSMICLCLFIFLCGCKEKISLKNYVSVNFSGLDGKGKAVVNIDKTKLSKDFNGHTYPEFDYTVEPLDNLHNGDKVSVNIFPKTYDSDFSFTDSKIELTVSGLKNSVILNPFKDLKISFLGSSPFGHVLVENTSNDEFLKSVEFVVSKPVNIENGDRIYIYAKYDPQVARDKNIIVEPSKMSYLVENLNSYISSYFQISNENILKANKIATDLANNYILSNFNHICYTLEIPYYEFQNNLGNLNSSLDLNSVYFLKSENYNLFDDFNKLYLVYDFSFTNNKNPEKVHGYLAVGFFNSMISKFGDIDFNNGSVCYFAKDLETIKNEILPDSSYSVYIDDKITLKK